MRVICVETGKLSLAACERYLQVVSKERQRRVMRLHRECDKKNALFAELLIRRQVAETFSVKPTEIVLKGGQYGKPLCPSFPTYCFSVSHSGDCVVLAERLIQNENEAFQLGGAILKSRLSA